MSILLVTSSRDLAVDPIVIELQRRGESHLRLDLDLLNEDHITLAPLEGILQQRLRGGHIRSVVEPRSVLYRAPTHLRESSGHRYTPDQLLARHQWAAFARSLVVFRSALWINHPVATYAAENKSFQLITARDLGFSCPRTIVANHVSHGLSQKEFIAIKALDSFLLRRNESDLFFYTKCVQPRELRNEECQDMPMIMQEFVRPKRDVRVTVIGNRCFPAETVEEVDGDWRILKERTRFRSCNLPDKVAEACVALVRRLGLVYGAIDLAKVGEEYLFFEINPTGEWAWIDEVFDGSVTSALVEHLVAATHQHD